MPQIDFLRFKDYNQLLRQVLIRVQSGANPEDHDGQKTPLAYNFCNYSSSAFFIFQFVYSSYLLYRLVFKNERSKILITAIIMMVYSSASLAVFYVFADCNFMDKVDKVSVKVYYIFCKELAEVFIFMAHWIIFYQYFELALTLPILTKIAEYALEAQNKIISVRMCLRALLVIVIAVTLAHFLDEAFYTIKDSSEIADDTITYFAVILKMSIIVMVSFVFYKIRKVIN